MDLIISLINNKLKCVKLNKIKIKIKIKKNIKIK